MVRRPRGAGPGAELGGAPVARRGDGPHRGPRLLVEGSRGHPTSVRGMECWLSFRVVEPGDAERDVYVDEVHAVRSGRGDLGCEVYVWDDHKDMWVTAPDDEEDE